MATDHKCTAARGANVPPPPSPSLDKGGPLGEGACFRGCWGSL